MLRCSHHIPSVFALIIEAFPREEDLRHKRCSDGLEESSDGAERAAQETADAAAKRDKSKEQRADGEEEGDEYKGEHESR